jgi:hypothetical protein
MNSSPNGDVAVMDASLASEAPSAPAVICRSERSHDGDDDHGCRQVAGSGSGGMDLAAGARPRHFERDVPLRASGCGHCEAAAVERAELEPRRAARRSSSRLDDRSRSSHRRSPVPALALPCPRPSRAHQLAGDRRRGRARAPARQRSRGGRACAPGRRRSPLRPSLRTSAPTVAAAVAAELVHLAASDHCRGRVCAPACRRSQEPDRLPSDINAS